MVLFTDSNFGRESTFHLDVSLVIGLQDPQNVTAWKMVAGQEITPSVFYWVTYNDKRRSRIITKQTKKNTR